MAEPIKVGLLTHAGGAHVSHYLEALAATEECAAVAVCDPDRQWVADARRILGDKLTGTFDSPEALLEQEHPSLALVTMEARLAPAVINAALDADCHVFAEKPACVTAEDFEPLVQKADSKHRHLMLALANRLNPEIAEARRLVRTGAIGRVFGLEMHLIADQTRLTREAYHGTWFASRERAGGGHLIWLGIHWLDLAMYVTDSDVSRVGGFIQNVGGQPMDVEDSAVATLQFDAGFLGTMTSGYYLDRGYHSHIQIWGSSGWMRIESMRGRPLTWRSEAGEHAGETQVWSGSKEPRGYTPFVQAAVKACAEMTDPPISNADSLRALRTVFTIYHAADSGQSKTVRRS
mgnify:CR=1 FL=1